MLFGLQALINMAVNVGLLPAKGMTLPFISYGGSSLLALALTMGFALRLTPKRPLAGRLERRGPAHPAPEAAGLGVRARHRRARREVWRRVPRARHPPHPFRHFRQPLATCHGENLCPTFQRLPEGAQSAEHNGASGRPRLRRA